MQNDTGHKAQGTQNSEEHADHGVSDSQLLGLAVDINHHPAPDQADKQHHHTRNAEEEQRAVLADQAQDAVEDSPAVRKHVALGFGWILNGDGYFGQAQVVLFGDELHLGFDGEAC